MWGGQGPSRTVEPRGGRERENEMLQNFSLLLTRNIFEVIMCFQLCLTRMYWYQCKSKRRFHLWADSKSVFECGWEVARIRIFVLYFPLHSNGFRAGTSGLPPPVSTLAVLCGSLLWTLDGYHMRLLTGRGPPLSPPPSLACPPLRATVCTPRLAGYSQL
jgi:hypothetical protein